MTVLKAIGYWTHLTRFDLQELLVCFHFHNLSQSTIVSDLCKEKNIFALPSLGQMLLAQICSDCHRCAMQFPVGEANCKGNVSSSII